MAKAQVQKVQTPTVKTLALLGAQVRLEALRTESRTLEAFIRSTEASSRRRAGSASTSTPAFDGGMSGRARKHRRLSAAARQAISERMTKYWAARRKANQGK